MRLFGKKIPKGNEYERRERLLSEEEKEFFACFQKILCGHFVCNDTAKKENKSVFYNIDKTERAIEERKKISFLRSSIISSKFFRDRARSPKGRA